MRPGAVVQTVCKEKVGLSKACRPSSAASANQLVVERVVPVTRGTGRDYHGERP